MELASNWILIILGVLMCCFSLEIGAFPTTNEEEETVPALEKVMEDATRNETKESEFFFDLSHDQLKTEYDLLLTVEEYEELMAPPGKQKRAAGLYAKWRKRWTDKTVNYQIQSYYFSNDDKDQILLAMDEWSHYTCLKFEENRNPNRVYLINASGCYSRVGMSTGVQPLGLARGCRTKRTVLHEIGHALGLLHEQSRPDRDSYVTINAANVDPSMLYNFDKFSWSYVMDLGVPYDYMSIMHYSNRAFSNNGGITIQPTDYKFTSVIGRVRNLSFRDIKTVNIMYQCGSENGCTRNDSECPDEGFIGKDCTCWCPDLSPNQPPDQYSNLAVVKHCDATDDQTNGSLDWNQACRDKWPQHCKLYQQYCSHPALNSYLRFNCAKTCNAC